MNWNKIVVAFLKNEEECGEKRTMQPLLFVLVRDEGIRRIVVKFQGNLVKWLRNVIRMPI